MKNKSLEERLLQKKILYTKNINGNNNRKNICKQKQNKTKQAGEVKISRSAYSFFRETLF